MPPRCSRRGEQKPWENQRGTMGKARKNQGSTMVLVDFYRWYLPGTKKIDMS
jgi:hypothetical protein